jgi:hypothetical protein
MRVHIDIDQLERPVPPIAAAGTEEFGNQNPAYAADITGETHTAITTSQTDPIYKGCHNDFVSAIVYRDQHKLDVALATIIDHAGTLSK